VSKSESRTKQAVEAQRKALVERRIADGLARAGDGHGAHMHRDLATAYAQTAAELAAPPATLPAIAHGEVALPAVDGNRALRLVDTLETPDGPSIEASLCRASLLVGENLDAAALGVDLAATVEADDSASKMLCHQLAALHKASLEFADEALGRLHRAGTVQQDSVEASRLASTAARMMATFQSGVTTLQRLRGGATTQVVRVEHLHVDGNAQAIVGHVAGGAPPRGDGRK
jgi:hypothetical protein